MAVAPEDAIRARRKLTNKIIAAHDAARLKPFFTHGASLITGDGGLIAGREAILAAFAGQFADPDFRTYVRETAKVELDAAGLRAAEHGRWTAQWAAGEVSGTYLACWRRETGQWLIESELFVTLAG